MRRLRDPADRDLDHADRAGRGRLALFGLVIILHDAPKLSNQPEIDSAPRGPLQITVFHTYVLSLGERTTG